MKAVIIYLRLGSKTKSLFFSFCLFFLLCCSATEAESLHLSFKKLSQALPYTFFYRLPISAQGKVEFQSCAYCPKEQIPVLAMPIVPYEYLAKDLPCYQHKLCSKSNGLFYKGLSCCQKIDNIYQKMSRDLHNLVPETRHMKQLRGQHTPAVLAHHPPILTVDKKKRLIDFPDEQRGIIARIYLYMADTYLLKLEKDLRQTLESWDALYEVTTWEKTRNRLIYHAQGTYNPRVEKLR